MIDALAQVATTRPASSVRLWVLYEARVESHPAEGGGMKISQAGADGVVIVQSRHSLAGSIALASTSLRHVQGLAIAELRSACTPHG
jgi:hypothetical protein